ncbi:MGMT family protein [Bacteroidia bacterium]|nr:MGMT family protein [Bacteroidia bacterium]MDB9882510.1 MGMT family protein [Bacteroidia bacterium]
MPDKTDFFKSVYEVTRLIPAGRVTSYGSIATYIGAPRSARMVGYAMNGAGAQMPAIPAHRVVNRNGLLTGKAHFKNENDMQELLENEGIFVKNDQVVNYKQHFWDPTEELKL